MLDDDESLYHIMPVRVYRCQHCHGVLGAFAFPECAEALASMPELSQDLGAPVFAFTDKDDTLNRAHVHVFWDGEETFFVTPQEFGSLVRSYAEHHVCASWN